MSRSIRLWFGLICLFATLFIAGCSNITRADGQIDRETPRWQGRLVLTLHAEPVQSFSANFDLQGDAQAGMLSFFTPLGTTVARLQWSSEGAYLQASGETQFFGSLDALTLHATGTVLPVAGLFAWLKGEQPDTPGWMADLQGLPDGRLNARRTVPEPQAHLKIILER